LRTAMILFNAHGVHTGIDRIIEESGVSKKSFYNHFPSKEKLLAAYLEEKDRIRFESLYAYTIYAHKDPMQRLLGIFDSLGAWINEKDFRGCPFTKGLTDFSGGPGSEPHAIVARHFSKYETLITTLLSDLLPASVIKPMLLQTMSLIAGTTIIGLATGSAQIAQINKKSLEELVKIEQQKVAA
jgi:AcrR family transcriptional regulator